MNIYIHFSCVELLHDSILYFFSLPKIFSCMLLYTNCYPFGQINMTHIHMYHFVCVRSVVILSKLKICQIASFVSVYIGNAYCVVAWNISKLDYRLTRNWFITNFTTKWTQRRKTHFENDLNATFNANISLLGLSLKSS